MYTVFLIRLDSVDHARFFVEGRQRLSPRHHSLIGAAVNRAVSQIAINVLTVKPCGFLTGTQKGLLNCVMLSSLTDFFILKV